MGDHEHHDLPAYGRELTALSVSATLHCLTGCAIGEIAGMAIGTALGFGNWGTVALSVVLAFLFGYSLTSLPLLRAGLALAAVIPIALASDTFSIAVMEIVDNLVMLVVPGALEAGLGTLLFWGSLSFALAVAFLAAVPVNRSLIARGKGHAAVHRTGIHGGPSPRVVGAILAVAFVFGTAVLIAEALDGDASGGHADRDVVLGHARPLAGRVSRRHGAQQIVAARVVLLAVEEDEHERLLGAGVVKDDDLLRGQPLRRLGVAHLGVHLLDAVPSDSIERHGTDERHGEAS